MTVEYSWGYLLFISFSNCFWIDLVRVIKYDRKYACGRRLYTCINTRKSKGLHWREITSLPKKNLIYIARHFNHLRRKNACSSQDSFVYNESLQHPASWPHHQSFANKDSPFFSVDHWIVHLFQSNQRFQTIEFVDRPCLSSQNMRGFGHATTLIPSFHGLC